MEIVTRRATQAESGPGVPGAQSGQCPMAIPIPRGTASNTTSMISATIARVLSTARTYHEAPSWEMDAFVGAEGLEPPTFSL
jgi:hypothetical protein